MEAEVGLGETSDERRVALGVGGVVVVLLPGLQVGLATGSTRMSSTVNAAAKEASSRNGCPASTAVRA